MGLSYKQKPGYTLAGYDIIGKPLYVDPKQAANTDSQAGSQYAHQFKKTLLPFGVLSDKDASTLDQVAGVAGDAAFLAQLGLLASRRDAKGFMTTLLSKYGQDLVTQVSDDKQTQAGLAASINAFNLYTNWDKLSVGQKGIGVANVGIQTIQALSGENLAKTVIPGTQKDDGTGGLTVGDALQLFNFGFNAYGLAKNWRQLDTVQKLLYGTGTVAQGAMLADKLGLIGNNATNGLVAGADKTTLAALGATPAPALGVGAITIKPGGTIPAGYTGVQTLKDGTQIAIPAQNAGTASVTPASTAAQVASIAGFALSAYNLATNYDKMNTAGKAVSGLQTAALGAQAAQQVGGSTAGSTLAAGAGVVGGLYGAYQTADMIGDAPSGGKRNSMGAVGGAASGAAIGSAFGPIGTAVGAVVGGAAGLLDSYFGSSKDKYQMMRDAGRKYLQKQGILDENFRGTLADGSTFDFGKDGKGLAKLKYDDPLTGKIIGKANLLAAGEGFSGKALEAMATLYTAAALSNANGDETIATENIKHMMAQRNFNSKDVANQLATMYREGKITRQQYESFENENNQTLGPSGVPVADLTDKDKEKEAKGQAVRYMDIQKQKEEAALHEQKVLRTVLGPGTKIYANWGKPPKDASNGVNGGSAFVAGLQALNTTNPYLLAGLVAYSAMSESSKADGKTSYKDRNEVRSMLTKAGVTDKNNVIDLPDGTRVSIYDEGNIRDSTKPDKASKYISKYATKSYLEDHDIDVVNDLDYFSGLAGIALTRTIHGKASRAVDQVGGHVGNAALASIGGTGADFTPENFARLMNNHRSLFAKAGIGSKEEAYALANQAYAEGRINDTQLVQMLSTYDLIFDADFTKANNLSLGRYRGLETLTKENTPQSTLRIGYDEKTTGTKPRMTQDKQTVTQKNKMKYQQQEVAT
jgi:hypothetical protein